MLGSKRHEQRRNELESAETARRLALMVAHSTVMGRRAHNSFRGSPWVSFLEILSLFRQKVGWDGAGAWSYPALLPLRPWAFYKLFHLFVFNSCFISRSKWKILMGKVCDYVCDSGSEKGCFVPFHPFKSSLVIRLEVIYPRQWKARLTKGDKEFGSFSVILFNKIRCL